MEKAGAKGLYTMIGEGTVFEGTIRVPHSIRVDGTVKGELHTTETLTVGKNGIIEATVSARNAIIGGQITGDLTAEERVELETNATLRGDLKAMDLIINEGAVFHGNCAMNTGSETRV